MPFVTSSPAAPNAKARAGQNPFAEPDSVAFGAWLSGRLNDYQRSDTSNLHFANVMTAFQHLYGLDVEGVGANAAVVTRSGEQGSVAQLRIPQAATLLDKAWNIIVGAELTWSTVATTTDAASEAQSILMKNALQYYWNDLGVGPLAKAACRAGLAFGEGALHMPWDESLGEDGAAVDGDTEVHSGDIACRAVDTWNLIRDPSLKSYESASWVGVREFRNRYDVAASVKPMASDLEPKEGEAPEETQARVEQLLEDRRADCLSAKMTYEFWSPFGIARNVDTDLIPVLTLYHKKTPSIPSGRVFECLPNGTPLQDEDLPKAHWKQLPVIRYAAGGYKDTPFPYSKWFGTLGSQQARDGVVKDILTNVTATSGCVISVESDADTAPFSLTGGPQVQVRGKGEKPPEVLQLQQTNPEAYKLTELLDAGMQQRMGIDALTAGQEAPSSQLSGTAMALLTSTSVQNNSQEQAAFAKFVQEIGMCVLGHIQHNMKTPRRIALAGKSKSSFVTDGQLSAEGVADIERVQCTMGTALSQTDAFKLEFATMMMKGDGKTSWVEKPQQLQLVIDTGRGDEINNGLSKELILINEENEAIGRGETPIVVLSDNHALHLKLQKTPVGSVEARKNPAVVAAQQAHEDAHIKMLRDTDPVVLQALGQTPLPPPVMGGMPGQPPPGPQGAQPPAGGPPQAGPGPGSGKPPEDAKAPPTPQGLQQAKAPVLPKKPDGTTAGPVAGVVPPGIAIRPS